MAHQFRYLFTPLRVGGLTLKNRIFSSGHAEAMAEDGKPGSRLRAYHEAKARGGAGLTIIGGSTSVHPSSPASAWNMVANHDDSIVPAYRAIADAVHRHDCLIMSQLTHLGRRAQSDVESWHVLLAPSQIPENVHREVPHEMEPEQIAMVVRAFGDAARRCRDGGLDGAELSFAHNHLVDQFWSPLFNRRTDEYGGSLENRMRFGFEILARDPASGRAGLGGRGPDLGGRAERWRSVRRGHGGDRPASRRLRARGLPVDHRRGRAHRRAPGPGGSEHVLPGRSVRSPRRRHQVGRARHPRLPREPHRRPRPRRPDPRRTGPSTWSA